MKKYILLFLIPLLSASCAVQIESVVDNSLIEKPYSDPLIVIPFSHYSVKGFSNGLKENLEVQFGAEQRSVEILAIELADNSLTLNANRALEERIKDAVSDGQKDLLLVFQVTIESSEGGYRLFTYDVTGIDTRTKKEVWKANFQAARGSFGYGKADEKVAEAIYAKLKTDKVL